MNGSEIDSRFPVDETKLALLGLSSGELVMGNDVTFFGI